MPALGATLLARAASGSGSVATFVTGCGEMVMLPDLEKLLPTTPMDVACQRDVAGKRKPGGGTRVIHDAALGINVGITSQRERSRSR